LEESDVDEIMDSGEARDGTWAVRMNSWIAWEHEERDEGG